MGLRNRIKSLLLKSLSSFFIFLNVQIKRSFKSFLTRIYSPPPKKKQKQQQQ